MYSLLLYYLTDDNIQEHYGFKFTRAVDEDNKKQTAMDMLITCFLHTLHNIGINSTS